MAGEAIFKTSTWAALQAAASVADGNVSTGARTVISTAFTAVEATYPLLDLKLAITVGTPTLNGTVDVYMRGKADTDESPPPTSTFGDHYIGSFIMNALAPTQNYYIYGAPNLDGEGTLYLKNNDGTATLTVALSGRAKTYAQAA